jgi:hypothetical protein
MALPKKPWLNIAPAVRANCEESDFVEFWAVYWTALSGLAKGPQTAVHELVNVYLSPYLPAVL